MKSVSISGVVTASVTMTLCGVVNAVFNLLRRALHLFDTVRDAAQFDPNWKDVAVSVYDLAVLLRVSSGILAAAQVIAGIMGIIYASKHHFGKKPLKSAALPILLGVICTIAGAASIFSLIISATANGENAFLAAALTITQLVVPIIFTVTSVRFDRSIGGHI